jgi:hypothetical protein
MARGPEARALPAKLAAGTTATMAGTLEVKLRVGVGPVKLSQLKEFSDRLQRTLVALAGQLAGEASSGIDFEIVRASIGSLSLALRGVAQEGVTLDPDEVVSTFTSDLAQIRERSYRPGLTPGLARQYRGLVACLRGADAVVEYSASGAQVIVDEAFRAGFEVALRERVAEDVSVVGYLDAVNAHKAPFLFYLYPKLAEGGRIECQFAPELLDAVAGMLKKTVRVKGRGYYAPVGIYPLRLEVQDAPRLLAWEPAILRSYVGHLSLVPHGMTASDYLQRNREAAGLAD